MLLTLIVSFNCRVVDQTLEMQSLLGKIQSVTRLSVTNPKLVDLLSIRNTSTVSTDCFAKLLPRVSLNSYIAFVSFRLA